MTIEVKTFTTAPLANNNYVVIDSVSHEALLIDCSGRLDEVMNYVQSQGATLKYILLTHGHFDHVMGVNYFKEKYRIPTYIAKEDQCQLEGINDYLKWMHIPSVEVPEVAGYLNEIQPKLGDHVIQVIKTPGHTDGSVCYLIDHMLFSGDTLFKGSYGRTDFPGGDEQKIHESLKHLFEMLPDDVVVYPGHESSTTIGAERKLYK